MKLDLAQNKVETFGDRKTVKFGIDEENLGLVYKSFLNYSNPIGSLVREIASNCFDSHEEASISKPITIKITDEDCLNGNPATIHFIDYGVGLSPERVEHVYCKFFTSTKRETNTQIGGFGIGAKSPLGYVDMFYVKTNYECKQYTYIVHKGELSPEMDLIDTCDTEESNGTEVIVNIKLGDASKFRKEIKEQLKYFDNINYINCGIEDYTITKEDVFINNSNNSKDSREVGGLDICIGRVRYPIDTHIINLDYRMTNLGLGLYFDIGEIKVIWTRESIEYTDATIKAIQNKLKQAEAYIVNKVKKEINKIKDLDNLIDKYVKYHQSLHNPYRKQFNIEVANRELNASPFNSYSPNIIIEDKKIDFNSLAARSEYYFTLHGKSTQGRISPVKYHLDIFKENNSYLVKDKTIPAITYHLSSISSNSESYIYKLTSRLYADNYQKISPEVEKAIFDKFMTYIKVYDDILLTEDIKETYKAFLKSKRKSKKQLTITEQFYYYVHAPYSGHYRALCRYNEFSKKNKLFVIGTIADRENLTKINKFIHNNIRNGNNNQNSYIQVIDMSKQNFDLLMSYSLSNVMHYSDFLKSKYIPRIVQRMADYECYKSILFSQSFKDFFPNNYFVKLSNKWEKIIKSIGTSSELITHLPPPHPELVALKEFYSGLQQFMKYEVPLFQLFHYHDLLKDEYIKRDIEKYLKNFKLNNYTYYGKLSKNIDNKE